MGWGRLNEKEQDITIISWYEICSDAGVKFEQYLPAYRAAQQRKRELLSQGQQLSIVTPHDLCAELDKVRAMHAELDRTRLLPETAVSVCPRCDGTGLERMPNGSRRPGCKHEFADEDAAKYIVERDAELVKEKAAEMREALSKMATVKAMPAEKATDSFHVTYTCTACGRRVSSEFGFEYRQRCDLRLAGPVRDGERLGCAGVLEVL